MVIVLHSRFLHNVQKCSDSNRMDITNLATVFGPNFVRSQVNWPLLFLLALVLYKGYSWQGNSGEICALIKIHACQPGVIKYHLACHLCMCTAAASIPGIPPAKNALRGLLCARHLYMVVHSSYNLPYQHSTWWV